VEVCLFFTSSKEHFAVYKGDDLDCITVIIGFLDCTVWLDAIFLASMLAFSGLACWSLTSYYGDPPIYFGDAGLLSLAISSSLFGKWNHDIANLFFLVLAIVLTGIILLTADYCVKCYPKEPRKRTMAFIVFGLGLSLILSSTGELFYGVRRLDWTLESVLRVLSHIDCPGASSKKGAALVVAGAVFPIAAIVFRPGTRFRARLRIARTDRDMANSLGIAPCKVRLFFWASVFSALAGALHLQLRMYEGTSGIFLSITGFALSVAAGGSIRVLVAVAASGGFAWALFKSPAFAEGSSCLSLSGYWAPYLSIGWIVTISFVLAVLRYRRQSSQERA